MKNFIQFIVYSNLWISCGAVSFTLLFYSLIEEPAALNVSGFIFFSTLLTYTYQRFEKLRKNERTSGPRMDWMIRNKKLVYLLLIIGIIGSVTFGLTLSFKSILYLLFFGLISFLYVFKIANYNLRDLPGLKIILIGFVWAGSCFLIPYFEHSYSTSVNILYPFIAATLYIIAITIPFDIRDLEVDEESKYTIPQIMGDSPSRIFAILLLGVSAYFFYITNQDMNIGFWFGIGSSALLIILANKNRNELYFSLGMDGLLIVIGAGTYLFMIL